MNSSHTFRHAHTLDAQANSDANGIDCSGDDKCRQEFGFDSDVNTIVARHGVPLPSGSHFGEVDYTHDLHARMNASIAASQAFQRLPLAIRERYSSWVEVLAADPEELTALLKPAPATPEAPPAPAGQAPTPVSSPSPQ